MSSAGSSSPGRRIKSSESSSIYTAANSLATHHARQNGAGAGSGERRPAWTPAGDTRPGSAPPRWGSNNDATVPLLDVDPSQLQLPVPPWVPTPSLTPHANLSVRESLGVLCPVPSLSVMSLVACSRNCVPSHPNVHPSFLAHPTRPSSDPIRIVHVESRPRINPSLGRLVRGLSSSPPCALPTPTADVRFHHLKLSCRLSLVACRPNASSPSTHSGIASLKWHAARGACAPCPLLPEREGRKKKRGRKAREEKCRARVSDLIYEEDKLLAIRRPGDARLLRRKA
ncbi:hypothetical protein M427DRAFT_39795 [Gonapodya prolifera JEL478]|uniref:Uncharacterized protein n=1 Tax=Gonapodya prolifera (strain JEL478) TaxID=1344416 RepID=A0A138ZXB8_GONPJ|nr:hypothetical protein M427DRAFT_39795 [Gonapodya prolifera JEL478]|eukprot:KXS08935.1 hypothetical protein M427DRAFT_39795 [Gonapodya prolifera JEL478]